MNPKIVVFLLVDLVAIVLIVMWIMSNAEDENEAPAVAHPVEQAE